MFVKKLFLLNQTFTTASLASPDNSFGFLVNRSSKSPPVVNGVNGHNLLTAVDSIAEEDEEGGDIDGDDAVTAALAKERTLSTNSNRSVLGLVKGCY